MLVIMMILMVMGTRSVDFCPIHKKQVVMGVAVVSTGIMM